MPQINGPIYDSSGRPATGWLRIKASRPFDYDGGLVTRAVKTVTVNNGVPIADGSPLTLPVTPEDIWLRIEQDLDGDSLEVFDVKVPDVDSMTYRELLFHRGDGSGGTEPYFWDLSGGADFPPEAPNGDWGIDYTSDPTKVTLYKKGA